MAQVRYGKYDTKDGWELATNKTIYMKDLVFINLGRTTFNTPTNLTVTAVLTYAKIRMHRLCITETDMMLSYAIAEVIAPFMPDDRILNQANARLRFIADVAALFPLPQKVTGLTDAIFQATHAALFVNYPGITDPATQGNAVDVTVPPTTIEDAEKVLLILSRYFYAGHAHQEVLSLYTLTLVSILKQGTATDGFLNKIIQGISTDLNVDVKYIEGTNVRTVWTQLGIFVTEQNIEGLINRWNTYIPQSALRLRLTVQQAAGDGLTALITIKQAILTATGFPWAEVNSIIPDEAARVLAAVNLVGTNQFFGYAKDLGIAKSTNYKSYSWVAKEVLIRGFGKTTLNRYRGWTRNPAHQPQLEAIIDRYVNAASTAAHGPGSTADTIAGTIETALTAATGL